MLVQPSIAARAILNMYKKGSLVSPDTTQQRDRPSKHAQAHCLTMARLTACFALSAVLVLATGISSGNGQLLDLIPTDATTGCLQFPSGQLFPSPDLLPLAYKFLGSLPPMRIISRGNTSLSVAADDNGNVVLAKTNCWDARQVHKAHVVHPSTNLYTYLAISL
jgi:hypothetical protein